ncbi:hypothetical protein JYP52_21515 [Nitratireductor aquibiodomus]|uniref:GcrA family cell cycle regulator n=1 Tax=Nitratireductor TaxID=245876 RepID=UPI000DE03220|nr:MULTISPECIES: GcrA family cell cycle regulator [Nitratireductor]MBN7763721.1 hypothetical protein [Nitratireductor aquibiodomus]
MQKTWTWDEITPEQLHALLLTGRSYSALASELGVSRNAVSGRVHRLRKAGLLPTLPGQDKPKSRVTPKPKKPKPEPKPKVELPEEDEEPIRPTLAPPTNPPVSILALEAGMCAVIVQESPVRYCGCRPLANENFRFCAYHAEIMISRDKTRRSRHRPKRPYR